jgi:uncharacterized membrane protein YqiK
VSGDDRHARLRDAARVYLAALDHEAYCRELERHAARTALVEGALTATTAAYASVTWEQRLEATRARLLAERALRAEVYDGE